MLRQGTVFVLSDVRSGSTLLDQCLGGHPEIVSLGEVHWLAAYVREDRSLYNPAHPLVCTCGAPLPSCKFWNRVRSALGVPLDSLQLRPSFMKGRTGRGVQARGWRLIRRFVEAFPRSYRSPAVRRACGGDRVVRDSIALYDAVAKASGRQFCVDSSKSPYRYRAIHAAEPHRSFAIVLGRDYRAVVHSKMKRGLTLEAAARGWRDRMRQIEVLTEDLPSSRILRLRYEALCEDPRSELKRICNLLRLPFAEEMVRRPTEDIHHIGGSPSKFDVARSSIILDRAYENRFSVDNLRKLHSIVGDMARSWGYLA